MSNLKRYTLYIMNMIDILSLLAAFGISILVRSNIRPYHIFSDTHQRLLMVFVIAYVITNVLSLYNDEQFLKRNAVHELYASFKMVLYVGVLSIIYMYFAKVSVYYSRMFVGIFLVAFLLVDFIFRTIVKKKLFSMYQKSRLSEKVLIAGNAADVKKAIHRMKKSVDWRFSIAGAALSEEYEGNLEDVEVYCRTGELLTKLPDLPVDSVMLINDGTVDQEFSTLIEKIEETGKTVYVYIREYDAVKSFRKLDQIGDCAVVSYHATMPMPKRMAVIKRMIDLLLSLLILPFTAVVFILTFIADAIDSHGPILISRVRVGRNGKRFYQYRFRIYRIDAEERMARGESGLTAIGGVLRFLHLDGLPMIWNIISGEMSFVGPKAYSLPELLKADKESLNSLAVNPGAIGYWSMEIESSSDEKDYNIQWSPVKDILVTLGVLLKYIISHSSDNVSQSEINEELQSIREYRSMKNPLPYDHTVYTPVHDSSYSVYMVIKRLLDIVLSAAGIIVLSPVLIILAVLVIADDGGSPFYGHSRIGRNGKRIKIYKFRSMRMDAGDLEKLLTPEQLEQYRNEFKIDNDPRITKIGSFIRKTSLDELPQLFNILFGSLSIVGPRPIVEEETKIYGDQIGKLLSVQPGLTGYWQAYARNNATYESGERQKMEMYYVDHQSLWLDIKIFFKTFESVLKKEGAK